MKNILFLYEYEMPTVSIIRNNYTNLSIKTEYKYKIKKIVNITTQDIDESKAVVLIRPESRIYYYVAKKAHRAGKIVISLFDDDLLNYNGTTPFRKNAILKTLSVSDFIMSANANIINSYIGNTLGKKYIKDDTIVYSDEIIDRKYNEIPTKIVYAAGAGHIAHYNKYIKPIQKNLLDKYRDKISITFVGINPDISEFKDYKNVINIPQMPYGKYIEFMKKEAFNIGLAPLEDDEFSKCKYFNKFIEYAKMGIAGVYSDVEPYTLIVNDQENGVLARNDEDSWFNAICTLIEKTELQNIIVKNSQKLLQEHFCQDRIIRELEDKINSYNKAEELKCEPLYFLNIAQKTDECKNYLYLALIELKNSGLKGVLAKIKNHFLGRKVYK